MPTPNSATALFTRDNLLLLRLPFSLFLFPIFLFACWHVAAYRFYTDWHNLWLVFVLLHLLVYPASNAYNSYMDQDEGPIGALENPPKASVGLYRLTLLMDALALVLAAFASPAGWRFSLLVAVYIGVSKAYSWHGIRLKKYPVLSSSVVALFQGGYTFWLVGQAVAGMYPQQFTTSLDLVGALAATLLVGALYPTTQIFQHAEDSQRGDRTLSLLLGVRGTFVFTGMVFSLGMAVLFLYFRQLALPQHWLLFAAGTLPVTAYFLYWAWKAWNHPEEASFRHSSRLNLLAAICLSLTFLLLPQA